MHSSGTFWNLLEAIGNSMKVFGKTELLIWNVVTQRQTHRHTDSCIELRYGQHNMFLKTFLKIHPFFCSIQYLRASLHVAILDCACMVGGSGCGICGNWLRCSYVTTVQLTFGQVKTKKSRASRPKAERKLICGFQFWEIIVFSVYKSDECGGSHL